jgi:hypothetical protein
MVQRLTPTPAQALAVWQSMRSPSARRVATKLRQAGFSASHMRVARWRQRGWFARVPQGHPLEVAKAVCWRVFAVERAFSRSLTMAELLRDYHRMDERVKELTLLTVMSAFLCGLAWSYD